MPVDVPRDVFVDESFDLTTYESHQVWWQRNFIDAYSRRYGVIAAVHVRVFMLRHGVAFYNEMLHRDPKIVAKTKLN